MAATQKDVIYIDIDDEITAIIDKVRSSHGKIVALVLPKRATVLQSVVNMKLLKRSAEASKKHLVLITSEAGLLPLAGAVGVHVAATLQSRPAVPEVDTPVVTEDEDFNAHEAGARPIGQLAGLGSKPSSRDDDAIELDDESDDDTGSRAGVALTGGAAAGAAVGSGKAAKKDSKLKVPDFNKFRLGLMIGGVALVGLLVFLYFAAFVLPQAVVNIDTNSSTIATNTSVKLDPTATDVDTEKKVLPAKIEQKQQSGQQQVPATGEKNNGERAKGTVTLSIPNCDVEEVTVPSGTGVSSGGQTFITQSSVTLESVKVAGKCRPSDSASSGQVDVVAQKPGAAYNIPAGTFTVAGFSGVAAKSSDAMTGGTDNITKVVAEGDIEAAKQKISAGDSSSVEAELKAQLENEGYIPVVTSLNNGEPQVTASAKAGDEAQNVTVSQTTTYTMYGIKKEDVKELIMDNVKGKIDPKKQKVLNDGVAKARFDVTSPASKGVLTANLTAESKAGPDIKAEAIKTAIKGKKTNDVKTLIKATPGVTEVEVKYSPFWVSKVPKKESKITIVIDKADATSASNKK